MEALLRSKFEVVSVKDDGVEKEAIVWDNSSAKIDFVLAVFGAVQLSYVDMLVAAPTNGWTEIINRWNDMGLFS